MISYVNALIASVLLRVTDDEQGQGMVEYGLIIVVVALAALASLTLVGGQLITTFQAIVTGLTP